MSHKVNAQSTIVERYLDNIFEFKKSISVKNPSTCFTLKELSISERFGAYIGVRLWSFLD